MNKYEAMFVINVNLSEDERKTLFNQINDVIAKHNGQVLSASVWSEKRKLCFAIKKNLEGVYYLVNFRILPDAVAKINHIYKLNENILRVLITKIK